MKWLKSLFSNTVFDEDYKVASKFYKQLSEQIENFYSKENSKTVTIKIGEYLHGKGEVKKFTDLVEKHGLPMPDRIKINKRSGVVFSIILG